MFDHRYPEAAQAPTDTIPSMPYVVTAEPAQLQGFISTWAIDSFFAATISVFEPKGWFNSTDVLPNSTFQLTTNALDILMPGFSKAYGDEPVNVQFFLNAIDDTHIQELNS